MQKPTIFAVLATFAFVCVATSAHAQYRPRPLNDPSTGESFHIEADATWWPTSADITVQAAGGGALTGLLGTTIDAKRDLGFTDQVGVKAGYRSLDFGYAIKDDTGVFVLKGIYLGAVLRY